MDKFNKLKSVKTKLEDIFFKAGGKPDNLKKAILNGKGNRDHSVSGIDGLGYAEDYGLSGYDEYTPLETLLGDMYYSENEGVEGLGQLGDPGTAAAIAAASGAVGALAAIIKGIGSLFPPGKAPKNEDGDEGSANESVQFNDEGLAPDSSDNAPATPSILTALNPLVKKGGSLISKLSPLFNRAKTAATAKISSMPSAIMPAAPKSMDVPTEDDEPMPQVSRLPVPVAPRASTSMIVAPSAAMAPVEDAAPPGTLEPTTPASTPGAATPATPAAAEGFWDKNKKWLKPTAIGVGVLGAVIAGVVIMKNKPAGKLSGLEGTPKKVTRKRKTPANKAKPKAKPKTKSKPARRATPKRKTPVALL